MSVSQHSVPHTEYVYSMVDDLPSGQIIITGLPDYIRQVPTGEYDKNGTPKTASRYVGTSQIGRVVHQYKNLLTEGDAGGKRAYARKLKSHLPLQNPSLRLPLAYTFREKQAADGTITATISFLYNTVSPAYTVKDGNMHTLTKKEIATYLHDYAFACSKDLEFYLQDCIDSTPPGEAPDFYKFPVYPIT